MTGGKIHHFVMEVSRFQQNPESEELPEFNAMIDISSVLMLSVGNHGDSPFSLALIDSDILKI